VLARTVISVVHELLTAPPLSVNTTDAL